jgi:hypothetical protein
LERGILMRGKRSKHLMNIARQYVAGVMKKGAGEGYNEYHQAMNRIDWEPQLKENGHPMLDPDGHALMKPAKAPGTITCAWHVRVMYQGLKKQWIKNGRVA